jgi:glycosyltransferase involved in cell wall biosynthesis
VAERDRKLKVLHLIETLGSGGAERLLHTNLRHFDAGEIESRVVTVFSRGDYWKEQIEQLGIEVKSLDRSKFSDILTGVRKLRRELKSDMPEVIHTHLWTANVIGRIAGRLSGVPVISSIHNPEYEPEAATGVSGKKLFAARQIDKWTARFGCTRMIAVSNYVRESAHQRIGFPLDKIDVVYNPIDTVERDPDFDKRALFSEIGLPPDAVVILNVGRVAPQKGLVYAIRAMKIVAGKMPHVHLLHVGAMDNSEYLTAARNEIERSGISSNVHMIGERRNIGDFLQAADLFVFPSLFEGLGIALAEAMAAGLPCVASDIRPLDEFVTSGENGVLVPPRNAEAIADAVVDLLSSAEKRERIGAAARETALAMFRPEPAAKRLTEIYGQVARSE